jgi:ring-1,2-phenylacetyl-CoA epoxidase subunit PaaC
MDNYDSLFVDPPASALPADVVDGLLALADDELIIGHRHSEWLGLSPFLEEDLTMASIAQDELGHARALYALVWPDWNEREAMIVRRPPTQWRCSSFVERSETLWENALMRHWVYDLAEELRWAYIAELFGDRVVGLRELATVVAQEERFHRRHAQQLVTRLAQANAEARQRLQGAFETLSPHICSLVEAPLLLSVQAAINDGAFTAGLSLPLFPSLPSFPELHQTDRTTRHNDFFSAHEALLAVVAFDATATW